MTDKKVYPISIRLPEDLDLFLKRKAAQEGFTSGIYAKSLLVKCLKRMKNAKEMRG